MDNPNNTGRFGRGFQGSGEDDSGFDQSQGQQGFQSGTDMNQDNLGGLSQQRAAGFQQGTFGDTQGDLGGAGWDTGASGRTSGGTTGYGGGGQDTYGQGGGGTQYGSKFGATGKGSSGADFGDDSGNQFGGGNQYSNTSFQEYGQKQGQTHQGQQEKGGLLSKAKNLYHDVKGDSGGNQGGASGGGGIF
ncbi:hypothetical protein HYPSUDRAFT_33770 [Hypholoma sublateritium FD-334 SS-4]|uniref:Uncharacterized protein n=1 Tax=Hypholoma sublateritium (strain FD-334 SS-4) TaxID=945553 RepID=A0A0D2PC08_HYPSF|nr:hypothetical protein HYPSUDRAFT_33770 [Hypholoma sublateritium FD-334 SS-4]